MVRHELHSPSININDIHHNSLYQRELSLAKAFVEDLPQVHMIDPCPVSGVERHEVLFQKWGNRYALCPETWSLSLCTLPTDEVMYNYLIDSDLSRFRQTGGYQDTFTKLRSELWAGQIEWIEGRVRRYLGMETYSLIDWGPRMIGWTQKLKTASFISQYIVAEPLPPIIAQGQPENGHIALIFDVIQRCTRPGELLAKVFESISPGGLLLLTCRSGSGYDVLILGEESESIFPLDHICLPSPQGMSMLLNQAGFEILEMTTPGLLDIQLIRRANNRIPVRQYFQRYISSLGNERILERLQAFLQQNNLSSHLRVVARKPLEI
jgi:hypothetical protein